LKVDLAKEYAAYYLKLQTDFGRMTLIWWLEERDMDLATKVRGKVKAPWARNPKLGD
jgi:hypothetical protein